jgi:hypothetical protein
LFVALAGCSADVPFEAGPPDLFVPHLNANADGGEDLGVILSGDAGPTVGDALPALGDGAGTSGLDGGRDGGAADGARPGDAGRIVLDGGSGICTTEPTSVGCIDCVRNNPAALSCGMSQCVTAATTVGTCAFLFGCCSGTTVDSCGSQCMKDHCLSQMQSLEQCYEQNCPEALAPCI